jgi:hypothetical protein
MNLKDQAQGQMERLAALQERNRRQQDARALDHRRKEWREMWAPLQGAVERLEWMGLKQVALAGQAKQVALVRSLVVLARTALDAGGSNDALTENGAWAKLGKAVNKAAGLLGGSVQTGWAQLVCDAGEFRPPAAIEASLPLSRPGNREALLAYRDAYSPYHALARQQAPDSRDDVVRLRLLAGQLKQVTERFNFDQVPEPVRLFFAAIDSGQGAPLALLTAEVREWLDREGQTGNFIVKSIG